MMNHKERQCKMMNHKERQGKMNALPLRTFALRSSTQHAPYVTSPRTTVVAPCTDARRRNDSRQRRFPMRSKIPDFEAAAG